MESRRLAHEAQANEHRPVADCAVTNEIANSVHGSVHTASANLQQLDNLLREIEDTIYDQWGRDKETLIEAIHKKNISHAQALREYRRREATAWLESQNGCAAMSIEVQS